jgi:phospholipase D1/2
MPAESLGVYYNADGSNVNLVATTEDDAKDDAAAAAANPPVEDNGVAHHVFRPGGIVDALGSRFRRRNFEADGAFEEQQPDGVSIQLLRSCTDWSHGVSTERSIANAYISTIRDSEHFVYIENQFFITATGEGNHPVKNLIGAAIVERIIRAHNDGQKYKIIVCMPSVPAFAGDLHAESSAGTLAIMNFQYRSISRGGHSIIEELQTAGIQDPLQYISFFNLRNYDRINTSAAMANTEQASGVSYEDARREHDDQVGAGYDGQGEESAAANNQEAPAYDAYQQSAADETTSRGSSYDSVAQCYMLDGPPLSSIPWTNGSQEEIDAFVSEELYIHTKCLIADDRIVIVGSANLNDRSQLGYHDSEIAVLIEDSTPVESSMNGAPYTAAKFAVALRRTLFRKHLGLIPMQDWRVPNQNYLPVDQGGNEYDWDSAPDQAVRDPLSDEFTSLWNGTASRNTEIFQRVFAPVPSNAVRNWEQYEEAYAKLFISPDPPGTEQPRPSKYAYGHVVRENFPGGVGEMKEVLGGVRGSLVTMPLDFLCEVQDLVKEGLNYNAVTDDIYT